MEKLLQKIDLLKDKLRNHKRKIKNEYEDFKLNYIYNSNAIEGNTLTLKETKVILEGITIGGKSLREHFEVINHNEAIEYVENIIKEKQELSEYIIKSIHNLILKNIDNENAGIYRKENIIISGANHKPIDYIFIPEEMERFIKWYKNENNLFAQPL